MFSARFFFRSRINPGAKQAIPSLAAAVLLAGCANPGPPKPPSLHLPKPAQDVQAERVGGAVQLHWTVPAETTDGGKMLPPLRAAVCREELFAHHPPCVEVARLPIQPGAATASDTLPPPLASGPPRLLAYRVDLFNAQGHSAGRSDQVYAAAGQAPAPMGPVTVTPLRNAAQIAWTPRASETGDEIRIERKLLATAAGPLQPRNDKKKTASAEPEVPGKTLKDALLTSGPLQGGDPGGLIDRGIHDGDTVTYTVERVRTVSLAVPATTVATKKSAKPKPSATKQVPASTQSFELHGEPSPTVTFVFHDIAPPSPPAGLAAIAGGGFGQPPSIDLSWEPNPEDDILGYNIYRAEARGGFVRLNTELLAGPSFRDLTAQPGHSYRYRVSAVDRRHHEGPQSGELVEELNP